MRRHWMTAAMTLAAVAWCFVAPAVAQGAQGGATQAGVWGKAIEMPGLGALNGGGMAILGALSCASAGNCAAGGYYSDGSGGTQAFVASERNGRWAHAKEVPGTAALNAGGTAFVYSVSCPSAGNCAAGGYYTDGSGDAQAFVASERNGRWADAKRVPGTAALNAGGTAFVFSVSCPSAGNCVAGGSYADSPDHSQAFLVSERNGRWADAKRVPGTAALNAGDFAGVNSVSCPSAGNCAAGGYYRDSSGHRQAFVVSERKDRWGQAIKVPGSTALNAYGVAAVNSVSCPSVGNCAAGGVYTDSSDHSQAFLASERNGHWGKAEEVPGTAALNAGGRAGGDAEVSSVSCASAGNCAADGYYRDASGNQVFVVSERNGHWGKAEEVPGTAGLNTGGNADATQVSCASAGNCAVGGSYQDGSGNGHAFLASQRNGRWGKAEEVPGTAALNTGGNAEVISVSCPSAGRCVAAGNYEDNSGQQVFVVRQT